MRFRILYSIDFVFVTNQIIDIYILFYCLNVFRAVGKFPLSSETLRVCAPGTREHEKSVSHLYVGW